MTILDPTKIPFGQTKGLLNALRSLYTWDGTTLALQASSITDSSGNYLFQPLLHVRDEKTNGNAGGTFTSGAWQTRTLNTSKTNEITGASLSSNQVTLPAGTYMAMGTAPAFVVNSHQLRIQDTTNTVTLVLGPNAVTRASDNVQGIAQAQGRFTLSGTAAVELQHQCETTRATDGFGQVTSFTGTEVYAELLIWRIA